MRTLGHSTSSYRYKIAFIFNEDGHVYSGRRSRCELSLERLCARGRHLPRRSGRMGVARISLCSSKVQAARDNPSVVSEGTGGSRMRSYSVLCRVGRQADAYQRAAMAPRGKEKRSEFGWIPSVCHLTRNGTYPWSRPRKMPWPGSTGTDNGPADLRTSRVPSEYKRVVGASFRK